MCNSSLLVRYIGVSVLTFLGLSLSVYCPPSFAQSDPKPEILSAEQVQGELKRIKAEINRLTDSPDAPTAWKELQKVEAELRELRSKNRLVEHPLTERVSMLQEKDEVQKWELPIQRLQNQRYEFEDYASRYARIAGKKLFEARHAMLARQARVQTPQLTSLGFHTLNYPQIDGSTSAQPLVALITCHCFNASFQWHGVGQIRSRVLQERDGRDFIFGGEPEADLLEFSLIAKSDEKTTARLAVIINEVLATNASTSKAYVNLIEGRSDLGLLARRPSADEVEIARKANVELQIDPCALDAFVFMVNTQNPVRNLTSQQVRDVYSGKLTRWADVGGTGTSINAYQREANSGSQELMKSLVMKETPIELKSRSLVGYVMSSPYLQLTGDENGLAYSVYYYEHFMSGSAKTRTIAIDGVEANPETIASRKYPYVSEVFVVTRKNIAMDAPAAKLRNWLLSDEGQAVVRESGYVPLR